MTFAILLVGLLDATVVEPNWIEVSHHEVVAPVRASLARCLGIAIEPGSEEARDSLPATTK